MDCKVVLTTSQHGRYMKVLRAKEVVEEGNRERTDAQLIQAELFDHISGAVLYKERQNAQSSVKEF